MSPTPAPPAPPVIAPLLASVVIMPKFDTPPPPRPLVKAGSAVSALNCPVVGQRRDRSVIVDPPDADEGGAANSLSAAVSALNCPAVGERRDRAGIRDPCAGRFAECWLACAPPSMVAPAALRSTPIVAPEAFDTPAPPSPPTWPAPPAPPLIVPRFVSVLIVPLFDTPAPPAPPFVTPEPPFPPAICRCWSGS